MPHERHAKRSSLVDNVEVGLDIYAGSLTRYLAGDWELASQKVAKELGLQITIRRKHDPEDAIRDPNELRPIVERWRDGLSLALADDLAAPLEWDESPSSKYFTDKPAWDGYAALILWAAYEEQPHLLRPINAVEEWSEDAAYCACMRDDHKSRYSHLYDVSLWLPCDFRFVFQAEFVTGTPMLIGSSRELAFQLDELNRRTWAASPTTLAEWIKDGADYGAPLETSARFAFSVFKFLADQSVAENLPMLMDY